MGKLSVVLSWRYQRENERGEAFAASWSATIDPNA